MTEKTITRFSWVVALCLATVSEFVPVAGLCLAMPVLLVVGGVHGKHPDASAAVMLVANFIVVFAATYFLTRLVLRRFASRQPR